ncbi:hypothetical protein CEXT_168901 [Caerostris extrusa]|uniref:Uncharacterized protein n=1 Tax=Caerostris extrusa TaxID=172846 RepID=A0AAV4PBX1_CAEEX|nr:hypothetical protein CEXT_168901 [Caerostris extrusa]
MRYGSNNSKIQEGCTILVLWKGKKTPLGYLRCIWRSCATRRMHLRFATRELMALFEDAIGLDHSATSYKTDPASLGVV